MMRWVLAAAACLGGGPAANAEYAITPYLLNKPPVQAGANQFGMPPGGFQGGMPPGAGFQGGMPPGAGFQGRPPGGFGGAPPSSPMPPGRPGGNSFPSGGFMPSEYS